VYGYVGNKAAVYPLQAMGHDVWPIHTVQFSNHTGYGRWRGEVFPVTHIKELVQGLYELENRPVCDAVLSGYMGSVEIAHQVLEIVQEFKKYNPQLIYLCDPVSYHENCYVKPEVQDFFKTHLKADILTPSQLEAEKLSGVTISCADDLKKAAHFFHAQGAKIVVITGVHLKELAKERTYTFASDGIDSKMTSNPIHISPHAIHGTGDLFTAVFLGTYLITESWTLSLQNAVFHINRALKETVSRQIKELYVLNSLYALPSADLLRPLERV